MKPPDLVGRFFVFYTFERLYTSIVKLSVFDYLFFNKNTYLKLFLYRKAMMWYCTTVIFPSLGALKSRVFL